VQSARGREFDVALLRTYIAALEDKANRLNLVQQARLLRLHILLRSMG
jgi:hypothetical protein